MITIVQGGSGSGKSEYAEKKVLELSGQKRYYLATMRIYDEEGRKKVNRHKNLRSGKGFLTIEQPICIEEAVKQIDIDSVVLLECLSNLIANEMFQEKEVIETSIVVSRVLHGIHLLEHKTKHLVIVTNNIFEDGIQYDNTTMKYMKALAKINEMVAKEATEVIEIVVGIPIIHKSERNHKE